MPIELPKKPKTNREKLEGMCIHDLLKSINDEMIYGDYKCVGEYLYNDYIYVHKERCSTHYAGQNPNKRAKMCSECISAYLNEEAK